MSTNQEVSVPPVSMQNIEANTLQYVSDHGPSTSPRVRINTLASNLSTNGPAARTRNNTYASYVSDLSPRTIKHILGKLEREAEKKSKDGFNR